MTHPTIPQLRDQLRSLTATLQSLGVTQLSYPAESIQLMSRSRLVSCINWAVGTVAFIQDHAV